MRTAIDGDVKGASVFVSDTVGVGTGEVASARPSALVYRIGSREYPMRTVPRCKTCQHPQRSQVETMLMRGYGYAAIRRALGDEGQGSESRLSTENLRNHASHMPIDVAVRRAMLEAHATSIGQEIDGCETSIVDALGLLKGVVQATWEGMADGTIQPEISEGISAAKALASFQQFAGSELDVVIAKQALMVFVEIAEDMMPKERFDAFMLRVKAHPAIKALLLRREQATAELSA